MLEEEVMEKSNKILPTDNSENKILLALEQLEKSNLEGQLTLLHPADFSDQFEQLTSEQRETLIQAAPKLISADVLAELEDEIVEDILPLLPSTKLASAITELDNDDATQIIEEMEEAQREEVFKALEPYERATIEASLRFDEETIGRLMQREFAAAPPFWTVGDTIDHMREDGRELPDLFFNIWVIDTHFIPIGYVPLSTIMKSSRDISLSDIMNSSIVKITQSMDQEEAAYLFEKYNLISAPVVDDDQRLAGIMTVDDIIEIIQNENKEDILALAGVSEASLTDTAVDIVRARAPWLFINLATSILASIVIAQFDYAITQIVALAILMPIVASMGGNAGTQALTVQREAIAAIIIGFIFAFSLALISYIWFQDLKLSVVAFVAMIINHLFAGLAGILVPLGFKKFGADPAVSSSVFVTTVTDIIGFFVFLGLAVFILI